MIWYPVSGYMWYLSALPVWKIFVHCLILMYFILVASTKKRQRVKSDRRRFSTTTKTKTMTRHSLAMTSKKMTTMMMKMMKTTTGRDGHRESVIEWRHQVIRWRGWKAYQVQVLMEGFLPAMQIWNVSICRVGSTIVNCLLPVRVDFRSIFQSFKSILQY